MWLCKSIMTARCSEELDPGDWDVSGLEHDYERYFGLPVESLGIDWDLINRPDLEERLNGAAKEHYLGRVEQFGDELFILYNQGGLGFTAQRLQISDGPGTVESRKFFTATCRSTPSWPEAKKEE